MSTVTVFVGLDYHQDFVQVSVLDTQGKQLCWKNWSTWTKKYWPSTHAWVRSATVIR